MLQKLVDRLGLVAAGALVVDADGAVSIEVAGLRRADADDPVTEADPWHLGSNTKAMTATLATVLVADDMIGWDTRPHDVFPELVGSFHPALDGITLDHLLTHTAGLEPNLTGLGDIWSRLWQEGDGDVVATRRWFLEQLLSMPPVVAPGSRMLYANAGYMIAGAMMEARAGQSWEHLITSRLFAPLGIHAGFGAPGRDGTPAPWGHQPRPSRLFRRGSRTSVAPGPTADNPPAVGPAGTVHCTLADYARFLSLHLRGAIGDTDLLSHEAFQRLHGPSAVLPSSSYGYGWRRVRRRWAGGTALAHGGSNTMWFANTWLAPAVGKGFAAVTNVGDGFRATDKIIASLVRATTN